MRKVPVFLFLVTLVPLAGPSAPAAAPMGVSWSAESLVFGTGQVDADPLVEILAWNEPLGRFEVLDPATGAVEYELPNPYTDLNTTLFIGNTDNDSADELVIFSGTPGQPIGTLGFIENTDAVASASADPPTTQAPPGWTVVWQLTNYPQPGAIEAADFDGIGLEDVLIHFGPTFHILDRATGATKYDWAAQHPNLVVQSVQVADLDLDGRAELLVQARENGATDRFLILESNAPLSAGDPPAGFAARTLSARSAPNPFQGPTRIEFHIPVRDHVTVRIFDAAGRLVRTALDGTLAPGRHEVVWDGRDDGGRNSRSGVFFYEITAGSERIARKMLRVR